MGSTLARWGPGRTIRPRLHRRHADEPEAVVAVACTVPRRLHSAVDAVVGAVVVVADRGVAGGTGRDVVSGPGCTRMRW